jgi:hypothetical protein
MPTQLMSISLRIGILVFYFFTIFSMAFASPNAPLPFDNPADIIFSEDFELGQNNWEIDNSVWELCTHGENAPSNSGLVYFSTICDGNYLNSTSSRLISPEINLPSSDTLDINEDLQLKLWHRFDYFYPYAYGYVQISVYDNVQGWSGWLKISPIYGYDSGYQKTEGWVPVTLDLTQYAGKKVKIAFFHNAGGGSATGNGWYIDNVQVIKKMQDWDGDYECGWGAWYSSNGVWEIGTPTGSPSACYSGEMCAGTVLSGTATAYIYSQLITPSFFVPSQINVALSFRHWYSYSGGYGIVQISSYDATNGWSSWQNLSNQISGISGKWTKYPDINLNAYAGKKVRIAFAHYPNSSTLGWYLDHIRVTSFPHTCECDFLMDGKCNILDYQRFIQDWGRTDCGTPLGSGTPPNDCECDLNKDGKCNILDYQRFIEDWGNKECQICP